ncbi:uncharacterized protein LOC135495467 [Lineus longissimus]|uniref:uncharacterized protein LOC135495467 n=1 Tax=Lineus longissimus TaxID=88925 RepID=UPI00315D5073
MDNQGMENPLSGQQHPPYPQQQWNQPPLQYDQPVGYAQSPIVVAAQPVTQGPRPRSYSFPQGKIPTVVLLLIAFANFLMLMVFGVWFRIWLVVAFLVPLIIHGIAAMFGFAGSFREQGSAGVAIICVITACISLAISLWQVIVISEDIALIDDLSKTWLDLIHVLLEAVAILCSIALIVIPSKAACCSPQPAATASVVYNVQAKN